MTSNNFDLNTTNGRSNQRYKKVLLAASSSIFYKIITVATGLISIPLTMDYLGAERFGIWMVCTSILSFIAFADFGLGNGLLNVVSKNDGLDQEQETNKYVSSVFFILLSISVFIGLIIFCIFPYVGWEKVFNVSSKIAIEESSTVIIVLTTIIMLNLPLGIVQKIQIGYQQTHINNLWLSLGSIIGLLGVLVAIYYEAGLPWLIGALMGGPVLANIFNSLKLFLYDRPYLIPSLKHFEFNIGKDMIKLGFVFFLLQIFSLIANVADNIIIAQILGASSVTTYAIAKKLFILTQISHYFIAPFWPTFNEAMARKEFQWAKDTLKKVLKTSIFVGMLCAIPILLFGDKIITLWVNETVEPSFYLLLGLFFWTFLTNYGGSMAVFLNNSYFVHKQLVIIGLASISSFIFEIILCYMYGIEGIIYGILLGHLIFFVIPAYRIAFGSLDKLIKGKVSE